MQDVWKRFFRTRSREERGVPLQAHRAGLQRVHLLPGPYLRRHLKTITTALAITASFTLLIVANIFLPKYCKMEAGFWTVLASVLVWLAWTLFPQVRLVPHVVYLEWPVCLAVFTLAYRFGTEPADSIIRR
jgi:SSS family solute:Na+ symporter